MIYNISAMVVYSDSIEAIDEEEAIDKFCADCPYDVDANTIECETEDDEWERLDDVERSEYMRAMAERSEE
jgi:hypothetical protein